MAMGSPRLARQATTAPDEDDQEADDNDEEDGDHHGDDDAHVDGTRVARPVRGADTSCKISRHEILLLPPSMIIYNLQISHHEILLLYYYHR